MVRKTKEEALATRCDILSAAIDVFLARGVVGASLEQVAEVAGVTRGAVYWHFKNKVEIFEELYAELHSSFIESIVSDLDKNHPEPLLQLKALCIELILDLERNPRKADILKIMLLRCEFSGDLQHLADKQTENQAKNIRLLANFFKRAITNGQLSKDCNPNIMAVSVICFLTGVSYEYLRFPSTINIKSHTEKLMTQFFNGFGV